MRLNHPDYIKLVIGTYKKKRARNELSLLLSQPTPANIRQECANVYRERYEKRDEPALRAFFGSEEHGKKFLEYIQNFDINKFRPLVLYLKKGGNKGITDKSLELLAWLIDFKYRPLVFDREVILNEEELSILSDIGYEPAVPNTEDDDPDLPGEENEEEEEEQTTIPFGKTGNTPQDTVEIVNPASKNEISPAPGPVPKNPVEITDEKTKEPEKKEAIENSEKDKEKKRSGRALLYFLLLIIGAGGAYTLWQQRQDKQLVMGNANTGCMYWAADHYETIPCSDKQSNRLKLPLDLEKMRNFKKITREDTITEKSIGVIYYIRINGGREYYTASGHHPVDMTRPLVVLSRYIYEKYLRKQAITDNDSLAEQNTKLANRQ